MKRLDTLEVKLPIQNDEIERRSRLVLLVYEVLRDMETPAEGGDERGGALGPISGVLR